MHFQIGAGDCRQVYPHKNFIGQWSEQRRTAARNDCDEIQRVREQCIVALSA